MPPTDTDEAAVGNEPSTSTSASAIAEVSADTTVEPTAPTKPDDNAALELALDAALKADEEALGVIAAAEKEQAEVAAALEEAQTKATTAIEAAQQRAKAARTTAESLWNEFYGRMKDRARRSPVRGGPLINWLNLVLVAVGLTLFAGCGASPAELTNLRLDVRQNEQRLLDVERLDGKVATAAVNELRIALDKQTAQLTALVEAVEGQELVTPWCPCDHGEISPPLILPMPEDLPPPPAKGKAKGSSRASPCMD